MSAVPDGWDAWRLALAGRLRRPPLDDAEVREKALLVLVDDLAAMVVGSDHTETRLLAGRLAARGADGEATLVGGGRADRERAATGNAAAAAWDEVDEGYRPATCHGGLYALPAAMAEVEAEGGSLDDLLEALVVGYEVVTAVARLFPAPRPMLLHPHATLSPIGAAAAVSWHRTHDPDAVLAAVDVAATLSMTGPFRHATDGLQSRNTWAAAGARNGFFAVDAAMSGMTADRTTLLDVFVATYAHPVVADELVARPQRWAILDGYHKMYAACQYTHAALEASATLVAHGVDPATVEDVLVETHPLALALTDVAPRTTLGGKFSVPHVVASVLATGSTDAATFGAGGLTDPGVAALRRRVRLAPYADLPDAPHDRPARVVVRSTDGSVAEVTVLSAVGGPDRPMGPADVIAKAAALTASRAPAFAGRATSLLGSGGSGEQRWGRVLGELLG